MPWLNWHKKTKSLLLLNSPSSKEYLKIAQSGAKQLNQLITGITNYRELDKDDQKNYEATGLILKRVSSVLNPSLNSDIDIQYNTLPNLKIPSYHLYQIFQNLIENSIKYNNSQVKEISISHIESVENLKIFIDDNGTGIDEQYLTYIFEPFKKLHSSDELSGTGLGLSICKKIVELYGGSMHAENTAAGFRMTLTFPKSVII